MSNYSKIKEIIMALNANELLNERIFFVGGTVPYLVSGTVSGRAHSDIDVIADLRDMGMVRRYLKEAGLYDDALDTMTFAYNKEKKDYGINCVIDGISVNFAPFEAADNRLIQRNFLIKKKDGMDALAAVSMENLQLEECTAAFSVEQTVVWCYRLEMIKLMKEKSNKAKDKTDIKIIDDFGYDQAIYEQLKEKTENMKFKVIPKNKILRLLFRS